MHQAAQSERIKQATNIILNMIVDSSFSDDNDGDDDDQEVDDEL